MYSPKIREDLIPKIYQVAKAKKVRMTTLVNQILEKVLIGGAELEGKEIVPNGKEFNLKNQKNLRKEKKDEITGFN